MSATFPSRPSSRRPTPSCASRSRRSAAPTCTSTTPAPRSGSTKGNAWVTSSSATIEAVGAECHGFRARRSRVVVVQRRRRNVYLLPGGSHLVLRAVVAVRMGRPRLATRRGVAGWPGRVHPCSTGRRHAAGDARVTRRPRARDDAAAAGRRHVHRLARPDPCGGEGRPQRRRHRRRRGRALGRPRRSRDGRREHHLHRPPPRPPGAGDHARAPPRSSRHATTTKSRPACTS